MMITIESREAAAFAFSVQVISFHAYEHLSDSFGSASSASEPTRRPLGGRSLECLCLCAAGRVSLQAMQIVTDTAANGQAR